MVTNAVALLMGALLLSITWPPPSWIVYRSSRKCERTKRHEPATDGDRGPVGISTTTLVLEDHGGWTARLLVPSTRPHLHSGRPRSGQARVCIDDSEPSKGDRTIPWRVRVRRAPRRRRAPEPLRGRRWDPTRIRRASCRERESCWIDTWSSRNSAGVAWRWCCEPTIPSWNARSPSRCSGREYSIQAPRPG